MTEAEQIANAQIDALWLLVKEMHLSPDDADDGPWLDIVLLNGDTWRVSPGPTNSKRRCQLVTDPQGQQYAQTYFTPGAPT